MCATLPRRRLCGLRSDSSSTPPRCIFGGQFTVMISTHSFRALAHLRSFAVLVLQRECHGTLLQTALMVCSAEFGRNRFQSRFAKRVHYCFPNGMNFDELCV